MLTMNSAPYDLFEQAVREHVPRLLAIARGIVRNQTTAEDIVQQALANLYQHRDRYDWHEPGALLRRAVVNESLRILRQPRMASVPEEILGNPNTPMDGLVENETVRQVRDAISQLPENHRAALVLCEYEQLSYAQIARTLGASVPQVKTWIFRARRQLAEILKNTVEKT